MSESRIVEDFIQLAKINSLSFAERGVADKIKELLAEIGIEAYEDDTKEALNGNCGNLYAVWRGSLDIPPILLSAHMDTVAPGIDKKPIVSEDKATIHSDGKTVLGADDLAGVVEIIEGIRKVIESKEEHRTVELLFPVAEEVYTKGSAKFDYTRFASKEAYCLDLSGNVGNAATSAPSLISFKVEVRGKASHAGFAPEEGINAISIAAKAISKIDQGQVDELSTVNIGKISGGTATNIVSDVCVCEGEVRSFDHDRALSIIDNIKEEFNKVATNKGASIEFDYDIHIIAYKVLEDENVVTRFRKACEKIGVEPKLSSTLGGSDNNQFNVNGISGIVVACGMENVHTVNEYIAVENLYKGAELVKELILSKN